MEQDEASVETPLGKVSAKGQGIVSVGTFVAVILIGYIVIDHKADAKDSNITLISVLKDLAQAQREQTIAQREMTCIISMPTERREREFGAENSLCKRLSRER
jgi:hypothetical protein